MDYETSLVQADCVHEPLELASDYNVTDLVHQTCSLMIIEQLDLPSSEYHIDASIWAYYMDDTWLCKLLLRQGG